MAGFRSTRKRRQSSSIQTSNLESQPCKRRWGFTPVWSSFVSTLLIISYNVCVNAKLCITNFYQGKSSIHLLCLGRNSVCQKNGRAVSIWFKTIFKYLYLLLLRNHNKKNTRFKLKKCLRSDKGGHNVIWWSSRCGDVVIRYYSCTFLKSIYVFLCRIKWSIVQDTNSSLLVNLLHCNIKLLRGWAKAESCNSKSVSLLRQLPT